MAKVSNPYNLNNIDKNYKSYSEVSISDDNYNFIVNVGLSRDGRYGFDNQDDKGDYMGSIYKNTTGLNIKRFFTIGSDLEIRNDTRGVTPIIEYNNQKYYSEFEIGLTYKIYNCNDLVEAVKSKFNNKFKCNILRN